MENWQWDKHRGTKQTENEEKEVERLVGRGRQRRWEERFLGKAITLFLHPFYKQTKTVLLNLHFFTSPGRISIPHIKCCFI